MTHRSETILLWVLFVLLCTAGWWLMSLELTPERLSMNTASTAVSVGPFYQFLEPYILTLFGLIASALLTWLAAQFQTRTGIHVSDQAKATVQQAAVNAAGRILASLEPAAMNAKIDVHSPMVAAEVPKLQESVGDAITKLGMTPERVADLVAAKVGILQSQTPVAAPAAVASVSGGTQ